MQDHCPPRPGGRSALLAVFLCSHCALTAVAGAAAAGILALPPVLGIDWAWVLPPFLLGGAFLAWLWWGARSADRRVA